MANEFTVTTDIELTNGELVHPSNNRRKQFDQTTGRKYDAVHDISTSEETITFVDVTPGWIRLTNLDATNYVTWGNVTGNLDQKIQPAASHLFEMSGGTLIIQANTAECKVRIEAFNT